MADGQYTQFPIPFITFDLEGEINTLRDSMSNLESGVNTLEDSVESLENEKQNVLTAGGGITISGNTISTDNDTALTSATKPAQAKAVGDALSEIEEDLAKKANTDGAYEQMTVGNAEQLVSTTFVEDKVPYLFRTSGGSSDIGDREYDKIVGGTVARNQQFERNRFVTTLPNTNNGITYSLNTEGKLILNGTATGASSFVGYAKITAGHVYLRKNLKSNGLSLYGTYPLDAVGVVKATANDSYATITVPVDTVLADYIYDGYLVDLTQMFGATIADYLYSLEQSTPGAGVAKVKEWGFFGEDYYEYDPGTNKSVEGLISHDMVGFNQWDEECELGAINSSNGQNVNATNRIRSKNYTPILNNMTYYVCVPDDVFNGGMLYIALYDANKNLVRASLFNGPNGFSSRALNAYLLRGVKFLRFWFAPSYGTTYKNDICLNLSWSGARNGEYEPYVKHSYPLDSSVILRGITKLDENGEMYYYGDEYAADGTVTRRFAEVDLGTLNFSFNESSLIGVPCFHAPIPSIKSGTNNNLCSRFTNRQDRTKIDGDRQMAIGNNKDANYIVFRYDAYSDVSSFKAAMSGVKLVYELAGPTTEQATPFADPQIVNDWGTEEYVVSNPIIPIGHETRYTNNLRDKLQHLPDLAGSDGDYIVRQTGSQMYLIPYGEVKELPDAPETNGTYRLQLTVSGGTPTLAWVAE